MHSLLFSLNGLHSPFKGRAETEIGATEKRGIRPGRTPYGTGRGTQTGTQTTRREGVLAKMEEILPTSFPELPIQLRDLRNNQK